MGCDIHLYTERREPDGWVCTDKRDPDGGYMHIYGDRNYDLFAILADVRNGRGFAGVSTGEGFIPIVAPRGLPHDCARAVVGEAARWGRDGHSHSHLTVAELQAYDWTQVTAKTGIVGLAGLATFKLEGSPNSWSSGISGPGIRVFEDYSAVERLVAGTKGMSWWDLYHSRPDLLGGAGKDEPVAVQELRAALARELDCADPRFRVKWTIPYYRAGLRFLGGVLPQLWRLGAPEDVRIVFWFDN